MATTATNKSLSQMGGGRTISYSFTSNETGDTVELTHQGDRSVQMAGTWNSATVTLQVSNDGTNWASATDGLGNAIALTADGLKQICEISRYIRAKVTSGSVTSVAVTIFARD
jgi:Flp pilus assembly protein TadG